jgi:adenine-specific DNA-methyltransferase
MSRLTDLLARLHNENPTLAEDLEREVEALADRRPFGLNFERHVPENVDLPGRKVRSGDKVRILPSRGENSMKSNHALWRVVGIDRSAGTATLEGLGHWSDPEGVPTDTAALDDLVVVAEFRDPIYPGLVSTGKVERGGDKPFHTVINGENYHALQTLLFTHRGKVDCIYIDPPYNSGAKDWKYNNDYVEGDDLYRHSKWLAFMERRLVLAKQLLNSDEAVLITAIDEKEFLRLGLLLEQVFPDATIQMVSTLTNPKGSSRTAGFRRVDEYLFFTFVGSAGPSRLALGPEWSSYGRSDLHTSDQRDGPKATEDQQDLGTPDWTSMMRRGSASARADRPLMFYPIYVDPSVPRLIRAGDPLPGSESKAPQIDGLVSVLPIRRNGSEGRWQVSSQECNSRIQQGRVRPGRTTHYGYVINYLPDGAYAELLTDSFVIDGRADDGSIVARRVVDDQTRVASTQWKIPSHNSSEHGSTLLHAFLPGRKFPFPKSVYAVEDSLRNFLSKKPNALTVDFFAGSGTTAHAVMRLNRQDNGFRRSILVTNNEVGPEEARLLSDSGLRPGDPAWESSGICEYITKPRILAAVTGRTPDGTPVNGDYKFTDEFPIAAGFEENVEFFTLSYESPLSVASNREFGKIAPLLWMRAGSQGRRVDEVSHGWDVADTYGVLVDLDQTREFLDAVIARGGNLTTIFVVTDEDRLFEAVAQGVPDHVEPVRLYDAYMRNFEIESGRGAL